MKKHVLMMMLIGCLGVPSFGGTMLRELWLGNYDIDEAEEMMAEGTEPDEVEILDKSRWLNYGDNYCGRLSGWLTVPESGEYQFHIASDDYGRLYVSQDEIAAHAELVAYVDGWTGAEEWDKFSDTQHSDTMSLRKGQIMAVYATMQEGTGGDNLAIGWTGSGLSDDPTDPNYITDWVTHLEPDLTLARHPEPEDGEEDVALDVVLGWTPGKYAGTHNVYFGTVFDDVNQATVDNDLGVLVSQDQDANTCEVDELELDQTYYWRVDEVNATADATVLRGEVWSFMAEPVGFPVENIVATASSSTDVGPESTIDGSGLDANDCHSYSPDDMWLGAGLAGGDWLLYEFDDVYQIDHMLVWNFNDQSEPYVGMGAKDVKIEMSKDGENWDVLAESTQFNQAPGTADYTANTHIDFGGVETKFVKFTLLTNWGGLIPQVGLSEVQFMAVPRQARRSEPASGATLDSIDDDLVWRSGRYAVQHELYLSEDRTLVAAGDSSVYLGRVTDRNYDLSQVSTLLYDQCYYWRVDEINGEDAPARSEGEVWEFNTPAYACVDDMESYGSDKPERIFDTWIDGYDDPDDDNSSQVGLKNAPYVETEIVFGGSQSMPFYYDNENTDMVAEAVMSLDSQDWTRGGIQALTLYFLGERDNENGTLYVKVNNARVTLDAALNLGLWKQWNIALTELSTDLTQVNSLTIGVEGQGEGLVFIDSIGLYRQIDPVVTSQQPDESELALWYDMEDDLEDGSGNNRNGTHSGSPIYREDLDLLGNSLSFDGIDDYVEMPIGSVIAGLSDSSFTAWVSIDPESDGDSQRVFDVGTGTENYLYLCPRIGTAGRPQVAILAESIGTEIELAAPDILLDGWHHLAVIFEGSTLTLYVDGWAVGSMETDTLPKDLGTTSQNWLGQSQSSGDDFFDGFMDEFRIYSRALSSAEIRYLAGDR